MEGQQPTSWDNESNVERSETNLCGKLCMSGEEEEEEEPSDIASVAARYSPLASDSIIASSISAEIELEPIAIGSVAPAPSREHPPRTADMARCKTVADVEGNVVVVVEDDVPTGDESYLLEEASVGSDVEESNC